MSDKCRSRLSLVRVTCGQSEINKEDERDLVVSLLLITGSSLSFPSLIALVDYSSLFSPFSSPSKLSASR